MPCSCRRRCEQIGMDVIYHDDKHDLHTPHPSSPDANRMLTPRTPSSCSAHMITINQSACGAAAHSRAHTWNSVLIRFAYLPPAPNPNHYSRHETRPTRVHDTHRRRPARPLASETLNSPSTWRTPTNRIKSKMHKSINKMDTGAHARPHARDTLFSSSP